MEATPQPDWALIFGQRIRQAREAMNLSQNRLAKEIGCAQQTLCHWEAGGGSPREQTMRPRVARALGIPMAELFSYELRPGEEGLTVEVSAGLEYSL